MYAHSVAYTAGGIYPRHVVFQQEQRASHAKQHDLVTCELRADKQEIQIAPD